MHGRSPGKAIWRAEYPGILSRNFLGDPKGLIEIIHNRVPQLLGMFPILSADKYDP